MRPMEEVEQAREPLEETADATRQTEAQTSEARSENSQENSFLAEAVSEPAPVISTPVPEFPAITFRSVSFVPPTVLASAPLDSSIPLRPLGTAWVPVGSVPM